MDAQPKHPKHPKQRRSERGQRPKELGFRPALGSDKDGRGKLDEDGNRRVRKLPALS